MHYTSKVALLAFALFGTSALALPYASEAEYNDLSSREFYEMYLEARADPSLDARDIKALDLEAREFFNHEAQASNSIPEATTGTPAGAAGPATPGPKQVSHGHPSPPTHAQKQKATQIFEFLEAHNLTKEDNSNVYHAAISTYLSDTNNFDNALAKPHSPYHNEAMKILQERRAKAYFALDPNYLQKSAKTPGSKYHEQAVETILAQKQNFVEAYSDSTHVYHEPAKQLAERVKQYYQSPPTHKKAHASSHAQAHYKKPTVTGKPTATTQSSASSLGATSSSISTPTSTPTPTSRLRTSTTNDYYYY